MALKFDGREPLSRDVSTPIPTTNLYGTLPAVPALLLLPEGAAARQAR